jgi:hypothetical protein
MALMLGHDWRQVYYYMALQFFDNSKLHTDEEYLLLLTACLCAWQLDTSQLGISCCLDPAQGAAIGKNLQWHVICAVSSAFHQATGQCRQAGGEISTRHHCFISLQYP